jgi:hypothetical protein
MLPIPSFFGHVLRHQTYFEMVLLCTYFILLHLNPGGTGARNGHEFHEIGIFFFILYRYVT